MWSVIDWNDKCNNANKKSLHDSQIQKYFKGIFQSKQTATHPTVPNILTDLHNYFNYIPMLDDLPPLDEVKFAIRRIHRGVGIDGLPTNHFENITSCYVKLYLTLNSKSVPNNLSKRMEQTNLTFHYKKRSHLR